MILFIIIFILLLILIFYRKRETFVNQCIPAGQSVCDIYIPGTSILKKSGNDSICCNNKIPVGTHCGFSDNIDCNNFSLLPKVNFKNNYRIQFFTNSSDLPIIIPSDVSETITRIYVFSVDANLFSYYEGGLRPIILYPMSCYKTSYYQLRNIGNDQIIIGNNGLGYQIYFYNNNYIFSNESEKPSGAQLVIFKYKKLNEQNLYELIPNI